MADANFLPARKTISTKQGVAYTYYEGAYKSIKDFPKAGKKVKQGTKSNFLITDSAKDHFAYDFNAVIDIPKKDVYIFYLTCDDGAQLYIDGKLVVDNGEGHSMSKTVSGKVALEKGQHDIRVIYYENYMGEGLKIDFETLTDARQPLPDNMLYVVE
jgi:hypothetical protein